MGDRHKFLKNEDRGYERTWVVLPTFLLGAFERKETAKYPDTFDAIFLKRTLPPDHRYGSPDVMLNETRRVLFFRALYEADRKGLIIPETLLKSADIKARENEAKESFVLRATEFIEKRLAQRHRITFDKFYVRTTPWGLTVLLPFCFILGLVSNYLGPSTEVNILLNPVMALLGWNLAIYAFLVVSRLFRFKKKRAPGMAMPGILLKLRSHIPVMSSSAEKNKVLIKARIRFLGLWYGQFGAVARLRAASLFHGLAACLAAGVVSGLYLRGLAQKYHFQWFSTFITDAETARQLLEILFGPTLFLGYPVFGGALPALTGGDNGPPWIHLLAATTLLYIIVPRVILVWRSLTGAKRALRGLGIGSGTDYDTALLTAALGGNRRMVWFDYSYTPPAAIKQKLIKAANQVWGGAIQETPSVNLEWGTDAFEPPESKTGNPLWLFCFNGAQTPEDEIHGEWMRRVLDRAHLEKAEIMAVIDHHRVAEDQKENRREAWQRVLGGIPAAWIDGLGDDVQRLRKNMGNAVWSGQS